MRCIRRVVACIQVAGAGAGAQFKVGNMRDEGGLVYVFVYKNVEK